MQIISSGRIKMAPNDEEKIISKTEEERGLRNRKKNKVTQNILLVYMRTQTTEANLQNREAIKDR